MQQTSDNPRTITVCLIGDDRERDYPVVWLGTADISGSDAQVALIVDQDRETLVYQHPDYGWCSAHDTLCRDFRPDPGYLEMTDERLRRAY